MFQVKLGLASSLGYLSSLELDEKLWRYLYRRQVCMSQMPFLSPNQQCQSTEWYLKFSALSGTQVLTTIREITHWPYLCLTQCQTPDRTGTAILHQLSDVTAHSDTLHQLLMLPSKQVTIYASSCSNTNQPIPVTAYYQSRLCAFVRIKYPNFCLT